MAKQLMKILIGIPSFRRPAQLDRLLRSLVTNLSASAFSILVVDNDPERSAESVVNKYLDSFDIQYSCESRPGVVHVRNHILRLAQEHDGLAFLDDDQWISSEWASALCRARLIYTNAILAGPVRYTLPPNCPEYIRDGGFFERREHSYGAGLTTTGTGNSYLPKFVIAQVVNNGFDPTFAHIGGEDTELFTRLNRNGIEIRWVSDAIAYESVPEDAANLKSVKRRYRRAGTVNGMLAVSFKTTSRRIIETGARLIFGSARYLQRRVSGRPLRSQDIATFYSGLGYLDALTGRSKSYYGTKE